jgi:hypothetical protein
MDQTMFGKQLVRLVIFTGIGVACLVTPLMADRFAKTSDQVAVMSRGQDGDNLLVSSRVETPARGTKKLNASLQPSSTTAVVSRGPNQTFAVSLATDPGTTRQN